MEEKECVKCGYVCNSESQNIKFGANLCNVCIKFAPNSELDFRSYIQEKIDKNSVNCFRKYSSSSGENQKRGMIKKASTGKLMSRPPFGYKFDNGKIIPAQNWREVEEIFEAFLNKNISLTQLAKKHNFSVNGLKKILTNFTYLGRVKFNGQIHNGTHQSIISSTLFNHVQNKLERLGIKKQ